MLATSFARSRAYKCNWSYQGRLHTRHLGSGAATICKSEPSRSKAKVLAMVKDVMLDPAKLRGCMDYFQDDRQAAEATLQKV